MMKRKAPKRKRTFSDFQPDLRLDDILNQVDTVLDQNLFNALQRVLFTLPSVLVACIQNYAKSFWRLNELQELEVGKDIFLGGLCKALSNRQYPLGIYARPSFHMYREATLMSYYPTTKPCGIMGVTADGSIEFRPYFISQSLRRDDPVHCVGYDSVIGIIYFLHQYRKQKSFTVWKINTHPFLKAYKIFDIPSLLDKEKGAIPVEEICATFGSNSNLFIYCNRLKEIQVFNLVSCTSSTGTTMKPLRIKLSNLKPDRIWRIEVIAEFLFLTPWERSVPLGIVSLKKVYDANQETPDIQPVVEERVLYYSITREIQVTPVKHYDEMRNEWKIHYLVDELPEHPFRPTKFHPYLLISQ